MIDIGFLKQRSPRTRRYIVGASSNLVSQGVVAIATILFTGILARYFSPEEFGIWSLLSVFLGMFISFDMGFGNALKNHISALFATRTPQSDESARVMFFSMFYTMLVWFILLAGILYVFREHVPWSIIIKTNNRFLQSEGQQLLLLVVIFYSISSAFQVYSHGFYGYQETQFISLVNAISKFAVLVFVVVAVACNTSFFDVNLINLGVVLLFSIVGFFFFIHRRRWKSHRVKLADIKSAIVKLYSSSLQFTALQVIAVVASNLDMFVISNRLGLAVVGDYSLIKRIYLFSMSFHGMALLPLWPAFTEAVVKQDYPWVKRLLNKALIITSGVFVLQILVLFFCGDWVIHIWTGKQVELSMTFLLLGGYYLIYAIANVFSVFLNSINKLKWQILFGAIALGSFVPLSSYLAPTFGVNGIALTLLIVNLPGPVYLAMHTRKIILSHSSAGESSHEIAMSDK